jgi:hypothetical protein
VAGGDDAGQSCRPDHDGQKGRHGLTHPEAPPGEQHREGLEPREEEVAEARGQDQQRVRAHPQHPPDRLPQAHPGGVAPDDDAGVGLDAPPVELGRHRAEGEAGHEQHGVGRGEAADRLGDGPDGDADGEQPDPPNPIGQDPHGKGGRRADQGGGGHEDPQLEVADVERRLQLRGERTDGPLVGAVDTQYAGQQEHRPGARRTADPL